jgi:uncharacterized membrane protein
VEKKKIEDLSNLVFGLALTLGAITLVQPKEDNFAELLGILVSFALSFLVVVWFWYLYNRVMEITRMDRPIKYFLNFILLFFVVIEPYLLTITNKTSGSTAYALDIGAALLVFVILYQFILEETPAVDERSLKQLRRNRNLLIVCSLIFFASILIQLVPSLQSNGVQGLVWLSVLILAFSSRFLDRR